METAFIPYMVISQIINHAESKFCTWFAISTPYVVTFDTNYYFFRVYMPYSTDREIVSSSVKMRVLGASKPLKMFDKC
jgi:hypothetical protein